MHLIHKLCNKVRCENYILKERQYRVTWANRNQRATKLILHKCTLPKELNKVHDNIGNPEMPNQNGSRT